MTWPGLSATLTGTRVRLEPLERRHADDLLAAARETDMTWMPYSFASSREVLDAWLGSALDRAAAGLDVPFATVDVATGRAIGSTRFLALRQEHRGLEIGWTWLARSAWRTGANAEAKLLQLAHAFETHGCMRVEFKTDALNERSRHALEALPAQFEGVFRKHMLVGDDGARVRDSAYYAIVDDDWPRVRAGLERRLRR